MGISFPAVLVSMFARLGRGGHDIITLGRRHRLAIDIIVGIRQGGVRKTHRHRSWVVKYLTQAWTRRGDPCHQPAEPCQENEDSSDSVHIFPYSEWLSEASHRGLARLIIENPGGKNAPLNFRPLADFAKHTCVWEVWGGISSPRALTGACPG